jgi:hypothetical protein
MGAANDYLAEVSGADPSVPRATAAPPKKKPILQTAMEILAPFPTRVVGAAAEARKNGENPIGAATKAAIALGIDAATGAVEAIPQAAALATDAVMFPVTSTVAAVRAAVGGDVGVKDVLPGTTATNAAADAAREETRKAAGVDDVDTGTAGKTMRLVANVLVPMPKVAPAVKAAVKGTGAVDDVVKTVVTEGAEAVAEKAPKTAAEKVLAALREAKPLRKEQEAVYRKARAARFEEAKTAGEKALELQGKGGEEAFRAELDALKGDLPKVQFESIRSKIGQEDIDGLFRQVAESEHLTWTESLHARKGLSKLLGGYGGVVPQRSEMKLLERVFGREFVDEAAKKVSMWEKFKEASLEIANVPRAIMSSFDLSAPFRQGVFMVGRPRQFFPAFKDMFRSFGSEKAYAALEESIRRRPTFELMQNSGLTITDLEAIGTREERFASNLAEKIPVIGRGVRASGRAYTAFLTKLRADVFDDLVTKAKTLGRDASEDSKLAEDLASFINAATGRGDVADIPAVGKLLKPAQDAMNAFFFSPKLIASRVSLMNPAYYMRLDPLVRKEAVKSLLSFVGTGVSLASLAKMAGADVELDARSSDFGKIRIGDTRVDVWGGFQQYVRMAAQLITGEYKSATSGRTYELGDGYKARSRYDILLRQIESKEAPIPSFVTTVLRQQDYRGKEVSIPAEVGKRFVPMIAQDIVEVWKSDPRLVPLGVLAAFGFSVQTFEGSGTKKNRQPVTSNQQPATGSESASDFLASLGQQ